MPRAKCVLCQKLKDVSICRSVSSPSYAWFYGYLEENRVVYNKNHLQLRYSCTGNFYSLKDRSISLSLFPTQAPPSPVFEAMEIDEKEITLKNMIYAGSSENCCIVCHQSHDASTDMIVMPKPTLLDLLVLHRIYAPHGVRCCAQHLLSCDRLNPEHEVDMEHRQEFQANIKSQDLVILLDDLIQLMQRTIRAPHLDFEDPILSDDDYMAWTGWTKD